MTTRTFKQQGQAYGSEPASIVATVDGNVVYSGTVNTIDEAVPSLPDINIKPGVDIFTWEKDVTFAGTATLEITVAGSQLLLTESLANYSKDFNDPSGNVISTGPTKYGVFFQETTDDVAYNEPFTNVEIDGVPQTRDPAYFGQYYWLIPAGSTFTATVNIQSGRE